MSETTVLGIAGILGTLAGVVLGQWLESGHADRKLREAAFLDYASLVLEGFTITVAIHEEVVVGKGQVAPLRAEYGREYARAITRVALYARGRLKVLVEELGDRMSELNDGVANPTDKFNAKRAEAVAALWAFEAEAGRSLSPWWRREGPFKQE
jgi:hypothetical protein